jgi:hypothetical protein
VCGVWRRGIEEGGGKRLKIFGKWKTFTWSVEERNGKKKCTLCDYNGRWLKDLNFLCCIDVLLNVENKVVSMIKVGCFL